MQYFGFFLLVVAVVGVIIGLLQRSKGQKLAAAPFVKTGEAASNPQAADAKGSISVEGQVACQQPLRGPQSGQPCIYFHYKLEEEHTKSKLTERGTETTKEWRVVSEQKQGTAFTLDDGSGPVWVQITDSVDADLQQSFSGMPGTGAGGSVGGMAAGLAVAALTGGRLRATERILPAQGKLFALGKHEQGRIVKHDGMLGKLILSPKGREGLMGATKRNMIIGFVLAGVGVLAGLPMAIFGKPPVTDECPATLADVQATPCRGHVKGDEGQTLTWTVPKDGDYTIKVTQLAGVKYPIWPRVTLEGGGKTIGVAHSSHDDSAPEVSALPEHVTAGTYTINVRDDANGFAGQFKDGGGLTFFISIQSGGTPAAPSASAVASAAPPPVTAPKPGPKPVTPPAKPPVKPK
jgi:hypothetical protein